MKSLARLYEIWILLEWVIIIVFFLVATLGIIWWRIKKQAKALLPQTEAARKATAEIMKQHLAEESHEEEL